MTSNSRPSRQNGVAVIMVMLIVALATTLAVYVSLQQNLWQRQVETQFDHTQARRIGIVGIDWARAILASDARNSSVDHEGELWAQHLPAIPVENGEINGIIEDRQGLFNLNSIVRSGKTSLPDMVKFQRLLSILDLPLDLAPALADWIDSDNAAQPQGAEDNYYLSLPTPYRCANRPLAELGELILVKGFSTQVMERLKPFVSVLPTADGINVNFAPAEVLAATIQNLPLSNARMLVQQRRGSPFIDIPSFRQRLPKGSSIANDNDITVRSNYFRVTGRASVNNSQVVTQALLQRTTQDWPIVIWQNIQ